MSTEATQGETSQTSEIPVFTPAQIERLERLSLELSEALHNAQTLAETLSAAARSVSHSLKRVQALRVPRYVAPPAKRGEGRPTVHSTGCQVILGILAELHPRALTRGQIGKLAGFAPGTTRTYIPVLRELGMIEETPEGLAATAAGLASVIT